MIKNIYFLWFQGMDLAPVVVKHCLTSWKYYNPTWNIIIIDRHNYQNFVDSQWNIILHEISRDCPSYRFSDIIRLMLLSRYGGLWVDATCFCNMSLDSWLPKLLKETDVFLFDNLTPINKKISNWFIYSEKGHYMIKMWLYLALKCYEKDIEFVEDYFLFHDLFEYLCERDPKFSNIFDSIPRTGQNDTVMYFNFDKRTDLYVHSDGFLRPVTEEIRKIITQKQKYLFKLSHKCVWPENIEGTVASFLFSTILHESR